MNSTAARRILLALACLGLAFALAACPFDDAGQKQNDLDRAEAALDDRDIGDAEMYFERYLRKNPAGERRWDVWWQLLNISLHQRQDKETASEYLEIMLTEFSSDPEKRRRIQLLLASLSNEMRNYDRAVSLWEALSEDAGISSVERAAVYRELSHAYLRRLEFTRATDMLEQCLRLDMPQDTRADCYSTLAEAQMLTDALGDAEKSLRSLLELDNVSAERKVLATFTLADVLEQQERLPEAEKLFESIRETYPNARVVEIRLAALKNKAGSGKPPTPKR